MEKSPIVFSCLIVVTGLLFWAFNAQAYQFYSEDIGTTGGCAQCHGAFRSGRYTSPADGSDWGTHLHTGHLNGTNIGSNCTNCHFGTGTSGWQVNLSSSYAAADGANAISCSGCHGRLEDAGNGGYGVGLRLHHINAGAPADSNGQKCNSCHNDSAPVGEDVMPPWYGSITNTVTGTTLNPCNVNGAENFAGTAQGNDNDGDLAYDSADSDCAAPECTENADCDDGLYCNGTETCDGTDTCQSGTPVDCSDTVGCTDDSCDEVNDTCVNAANDANCPDDGQFCTGTEYCDVVDDCTATGDPCGAGETCNESTDNCDVPAVCGNGTIETGETCDDGAANGSTTCGCQTDCTYAPAATSCADGLYCNGDETTCDGAGSCQPGIPVDCSDGVGCTEDICDEDGDVCVNIADNTNCPDDGSFCNGTEFCDEANDCSSSGDPCSGGDICNETTDSCDQPGVCGDGTVDAGEDCDDGAVKQEKPIRCPLFFGGFSFHIRFKQLMVAAINRRLRMIPKGSRCTVYMLSINKIERPLPKSSGRACLNEH